MFVLVVGAGRVGSSVATSALRAGHTVSVLVEAGVAEADVFIASTNGDNTNLVVAQIAQRRFDVPKVIARVLDPRRAAWYQEQGLHTICPTQIAIEQLEKAALEI